MLRGVNRRIIEVNDCNSSYFERAIFIIRADAAGVPESSLKNEADRMLNNMSRPPSARRRKYKISRRALWLITLLSVASAVALAVVHFL